MKNLKQQCQRYPLEMGIRVVGSTLWILFLAWFFYRKLWMSVFLIPVWLVTLCIESMELRRKKQFLLESMFQEYLTSLAAGLRAGYALTNAFEGALKELTLLHGEKSLLIKEMKRVCRATREGVKPEVMLSEIGKELNCEAMRELGEVLQIATRVGGNLAKTITGTSKLLHDRHALRQEIEDGLAGRKFEAKIMECIPFVLVLYVELGSPGFFNGLYGNTFGSVVMTGCLVAYMVSKVWMHSIIKQVMEG